MKTHSIIGRLIAVVFLLSSSESAYSLTVLGLYGQEKHKHIVRGTVVNIDEARRSFTLQWKGGKGDKMGDYSLGYKCTFRVTDATVYTNGSWADMKKGVRVSIKGESNDAVERVEFTK